jgi:hypothetical protein
MPLRGKELLKLVRRHRRMAPRELARLAGYIGADATGVLVADFNRAYHNARRNFRQKIVSSGRAARNLRSVEKLSIKQLFVLATSHLPPVQDARFHELLDRHQENSLTRQEKQQLKYLMAKYTRCTVRKSEAMAELSRRGVPLPGFSG